MDVGMLNDLVAVVACRARRLLRRGERGQGMTEYALILVLIGVVVIFVIGLVGHQANNLFSNISNGFGP